MLLGVEPSALMLLLLPMKFRCASRLPRVVACLLLLLAAPASLFAQIIFTVTATANTTALGYTLSQPVTFNFVLDNFSPTAPTGGPGSDRKSVV